MQWEARSVGDIGLDWQVFLFCATVENLPEAYGFIKLYEHGNSLEKRLKPAFWLHFRWSYYRELAETARDFDVVLLRYSPYNFLQALYIWRSKKPVYLVHHTFEVNELEDGRGLRGWILARLEEVFGRLSLTRASGLVGVTKEIADYENRRAGGGKKTFVYPNGVLLADGALEDQRGDVPELLFVASSFVPWHGLDLIIDEFLQLKEDFRLHLVGYIPNELYQRFGSDPRFVCHGVIDADGIKRLANTSWIGLSSFALFRKGMKDACTLKVREYLASGLPVYSGHNDVFPTDFAFYRHGAPSATAILQYARECRNVRKEDVLAAALPYIDKRRLMARLYGEIKKDACSRVQVEL